jgi:hypothetical protein
LQILKSTAVVISPAQSKGCKIYGQFVGFTYPSGIVAYMLSGGFFSRGRYLSKIRLLNPLIVFPTSNSTSKLEAPFQRLAPMFSISIDQPRGNRIDLPQSLSWFRYPAELLRPSMEPRRRIGASM